GGNGGRYGPIACSVVLNGPDSLLGLREDLTDGDAQLGAGLQDSHTRASEREVFPVGLLDETIQGRIVEGPPPVAVFCPSRLLPLLPSPADPPHPTPLITPWSWGAGSAARPCIRRRPRA